MDILRASPIDDPLRALQLLAGQVVAWQAAIAERVDMAALVDGDTNTIRGEVLLWERAMDRCNVVLATIAKLNIDERLARIDELTAQMLVRALEAGLASIGVTGTQAEQAKAATGRHLRLMSSERDA